MYKSFCAYLREKLVDLRQTKTKVILDPFYTHCRIHFTSGSASFLELLCQSDRNLSFTQYWNVVYQWMVV